MGDINNLSEDEKKAINESKKQQFADMRLAFYYLSLLKSNLENSKSYYLKRYEESDKLLTNELAKAKHVQCDINTICGWLQRNAAYTVDAQTVSHLNNDYTMKKVIEF